MLAMMGWVPTFAAEPELTHLKTDAGVAYAVWGGSLDSPAPVLINLANSIEGTLGSAYFRQSGNALADLGYLVVSLDIPGHGTQHRAGEPPAAHHAADFWPFISRPMIPGCAPLPPLPR